MSGSCSIVIPTHNRAGLTRQCIDALLADPPRTPFEIVVVDDASTDSTARLLESYGDRIRVVSLSNNVGFATACNEGAAAGGTENIVFLNNDTIPQAGWLDALTGYAAAHPSAAVLGAKLLFPDDSIQHAGVVVCRDWNPRHLYAGFPSDHPAVNRSREFQAVTAACALVRREQFEEVGGFDRAFHNCLEDTDLCLRIRERGHEVHYCHESVLYHLESVSRGRRSKDVERNAKLFRDRWQGRARRDDLDYYLADGLLRIRYRDSFPIGLEVSPELGFVIGDERASERLLDAQSRHVTDLLREAVRLSARVADLELRGASGSHPQKPPPARAAAGEAVDHDQLLRRAEQIEIEIYELQAALAAVAGDDDGELSDAEPRLFEPSEQLGYRKLVAEIRRAAVGALPAGATVLVASRGDDDLLDLDGLRGSHFPQDEDGVYAGHYPADGDAAVAHLEELRARGAQYLLLPATSLWWLERYPELGAHLRERHRVALENESCTVFDLGREKDPENGL